MHDAARVLASHLAEDRDGVVLRLPAVHDDGLAELAAQGEELSEARALNLRGGVHVVVVEADLADGEDLRIGRQRAVLGVRREGPVLGLVGMDADRGEDLLDVARECKRAARAGEPVTRAHHDEPVQPRLPGAAEHLVPVLVEPVDVDVAVGVDERHGGEDTGGARVLHPSGG